MAILLKEDDFNDGGLFSDLDIPTKLPVPAKIMEYVYGEEYLNTNETFFCLDKSSQMNLLKYIWKLKGFEMDISLCKGHLVPKTDSQIICPPCFECFWKIMEQSPAWLP